MQYNFETAPEKNKTDTFGMLFVAGMLFLPMTSTGNMLRLAVSLFLLLLLFFKGRVNTISKEYFSLFAIMLTALILPYVTVSFAEGMSNTTKWLHEFQRIGFYCVLILVVSKYRISFKSIYFLCIFLLAFNLSIQILQLMGVDAVFDFIKKYYVGDGETSVQLSSAYSKSLLRFRSGSIYLNPNIYMGLPLIFFAVFLQEQLLRPAVKNIILCVLTMVSLFFTGSRTAFVVAFVIFALFLIKNKQLAGLRWVLLFWFAVISIFVLIIFSSQYRVFKLTDGIGGSLGFKVNRFINYFKGIKPIYLITGSLSSYSELALKNIDSELGLIYVYFGVLGYVWYSKFLKIINVNEEKYPYLTSALRTTILLISITAAVVLCMPIFPFFCLIAVAKIEE